MKRNINCKYCNKNFIGHKITSIFCSKSCACLFRIKIKKTFINHPRKKTGIFLQCIVCKKDYYIPQYRIKKGVSKYCSRNCLAKNHLKKYIKIYGFKKTNLPPHKYKTIRIDGKQVRFHRWLIEKELGRKLNRDEHVHHINGNSLDNRLENLIVLSNAEHQKEELKLKRG